MNPTVNLIFTIAGGALVLLCLFGAVTANRKVFLSGLCFFSLLPMIGEYMAYNADKAPVHVVVIFVFVVQAILSFPNNIVYGADNAAAGKLTSKIAWALLVINAVGAYFVLGMDTKVPAQFGYYHASFCLAILILLYKRMSATSGWAWSK